MSIFIKYFIIKQFKYNCQHNLKIKHHKIEYYILDIRFFPTKPNRSTSILIHRGASMGTDIGTGKNPERLSTVTDNKIVSRQSSGSYFLKKSRGLFFERGLL